MTAHRAALALSTIVLACSAVTAGRQAAILPAAAAPWAAWIEQDSPFFSSTIDARTAGAPFPAGNLTPRGVVLNLGDGYWAGFDTDLLRVAAIWQGDALTPVALAPGSYHHPDRKPPIGQSSLPEPGGPVRLANGIYPGWQAGARPALTDPREPAPSPEEVGRGPLPAPNGRFDALRLVPDGVVLEYRTGTVPVREWFTASRRGGVERHLSIGSSAEALWLAAGSVGPGWALSISSRPAGHARLERVPAADGGDVWMVHVAAHRESVALSLVLAPEGTPATDPLPIPDAMPGRRWASAVVTAVRQSTANAAYVVDDVGLPEENPWRRAVRISDIQFLSDGTGVAVTLDGDVWFARGIHGPQGPVRWTRFASGLHEPLTLAIRGDEPYVFDRNGIWRLRDTDGNGEADVHELFSNAFAQTAETREFPNTLRLAPGGEFVIAKGNQQTTTIGKHNGTVLRISADGRTATELGYGFRQPNLGVNPRTGLVTASDQQGHYVPATPLHIVRDRQFYGFLSDKLPREVYPAPIADPLTWIPHAANASAMSQVWLFGARMGPLTDALVHIGYNDPEVFRVMLNERGERLQAAVVSITRDFDFPPLNGSVNPADGQLYLAGFQVLGWGTTATRLAGLGRVRYTGAPSPLPRELVPTETGVLLRFDVPLDPARAEDPDSYVITSWHYKRTYQYGSPQFREDGTTGVDRLVASRAYVSKDRRAVFVAVPGMKPVMQMRLAWSLASADGAPLQESAYFTPYVLTSFDPRSEGFGDIAVDLTPRAAAAPAGPAAVTPEEGRRLAQMYGCIACHSLDGAVSRLGPSWKGLFGSPRPYARGALRTTADDAYLRESILDPVAKVVEGYEKGDVGMPSYAGVLSDAQVEAVLLFIKSLK